ncbi:MAG: histidinol dehydrogenase, partial [Firmicutes bacterium HGW-Firmicutes-13]
MIKIYTRVEWEELKQRRDIGSWETQEKAVKDIIEEVRERGDQALKDYTLKFDGASLKSLIVEDEELKEAKDKVGPEFIRTLHRAIKNIEKYHRRQIRNSLFHSEKNGIMMGYLIIPLRKVGAYIPGGTASYPSSVLMNVIPAKIAGVKEIYLATPPGKDGKINPYTLAAAGELGVTQIFKMGGAQAVGALAYGTDTVPVVDKIVGPGNIYVTLAKKQVYGDVDIDMLAGPSELLIIADSLAEPDFVAADIMTQAEHDPLAANYLVTPDRELPDKVLKAVREQLPSLSRRDII